MHCELLYVYFICFFNFGEFYKSYINSLCISQKFKIRKIISTRYDLSQPICNEKYFKFNPQIDIISNKCIFEPQDFIYLNNSIHPKLPTQKEVEAVKKFYDKHGVILDILEKGDDKGPSKKFEDIYIDEEDKEDDNLGINIESGE